MRLIGRWVAMGGQRKTMIFDKKSKKQSKIFHFWRGGRSWREFYFVLALPRLNWKEFRCDVNFGLGFRLGLLFCSNGFSNTDSVFLALPFLCVTFSTNQGGKGAGMRSLETGFSVSHDWGYVSIGHDDSGWSKSGWHFSFSPFRVLFGRTKYSEFDIERVERIAWIDGEQHALKIRRFTSVWAWPRWPFKRRFNRADIEPVVPVAIPGKGENGYDCGEDAIHSLTVKCKNADQAVAKFVENVLNARFKRR